MPLFNRQDREAVSVGIAIFTLVALCFSVVALVVAAQADEGGGTPAGAVQVSLGEFFIQPAEITAPVDGTLAVTNTGTSVPTSRSRAPTRSRRT